MFNCILLPTNYLVCYFIWISWNVIGTVFVYSHLNQLNLSGIFSLTITTSPEINVTLGSNSFIVLNCTFEHNDNEFVRIMSWKKKLPGANYLNLVEFSYKSAVYIEHGLSLANRSNLHPFDDISNSAILNITNIRCEDFGQYQCIVSFSVGPTAKTDQRGTTVYIEGISFWIFWISFKQCFLLLFLK